jgi:beta-galactosidase/beta-glucuronidase
MTGINGEFTMKLKDAARTLRFKGEKPEKKQLYTIWGEQLDTEHVLEEYPRPQLRRDNFIILNGFWNYSITKDADLPKNYDGEILVPFSPESVLSGVNRHLKPGEYLWYERTLCISDIPVGRHCILHFGAVDQYCEVFINHQKMVQHMGGYLPFSVDITEQLTPGENIITIKVVDDTDSSYHSRGKQKLGRGGMFYTAQSGIWQTVWTEWVPDLYITSLKITPIVDQSSVHVDIFLNDDFKRESLVETCFRIDIFEEHKLIQSVISKFPFVTVSLSEFKYWSPEEPNLYDIVITACEDRVESYFAMRKVEVKKDTEGHLRINLNDKPYFQNGLLDQGYWPDGLYTAPSDDALIYDIEKAKELGFNMLRKHIKIESLRWYYHCDRLGMLVWQDMVNGGEKYHTLLVGYLPTLFPKLAAKIKDNQYGLLGRGKVEGRKEWIKECRGTVSLLYNNPSIIVWVPFNEGWGQFDAKNIYDMLHELDTTRLIDHASGWFDQGCGDFESIHNYFHSMRAAIKKRPIVLSEYGGYACYIPHHSFSHQIYGYRIYLTKEEFDQAYHHLLETEIIALKLGGMSAAVFTQLSDVEDEVNGLMTYDRKVCKVTPVIVLS